MDLQRLCAIMLEPNVWNIGFHTSEPYTVAIYVVIVPFHVDSAHPLPHGRGSEFGILSRARKQAVDHARAPPSGCRADLPPKRAGD